MIDRYQWRDKELAAKPKRTNYHTNYFCGGEIVTQLLCISDKMFMPTIIKKYALNWYHAYLLIMGMYITEDISS